MSGTSLDGLDIVYASFEQDKPHNFEIVASETIKYDPELKQKLSDCFNYNAWELEKWHHEFGRWLGQETNKFIAKHQAEPLFVASHGHTVFHEPHLGFTTQIGSGAQIYAQTGITTVCDFRTVDVAKGGQGAPLVPIGDRDLFAGYDYLLNLGGIANITFNITNQNPKPIAFDVCVANMALNYFSQKLGKEYDKNGETARSGTLNIQLCNALNDLSFFSEKAPKSIGREFFEREFLPLINSFHLQESDILNTLCNHIALQIKNVLPDVPNKHTKLLVTGGGALNGYLMECISSACSQTHTVIPDKKIVEFKEALIFAYLGLLRLQNKPNCLHSVTGATSDSTGGAIYGDHNTINNHLFPIL